MYCSCDATNRLQPVRATREKQLVLWKQLILEYHRTHGLPLFQPFSSALFENVKISRMLFIALLLSAYQYEWLIIDCRYGVIAVVVVGKMAQEGRLAVAEYLIRCGNGSWEDDTHTRCRIMWKKPAEWAAEIYDYVRLSLLLLFLWRKCSRDCCYILIVQAKECGMVGNVFTVYELYAGEETLGSSACLACLIILYF